MAQESRLICRLGVAATWMYSQVEADSEHPRPAKKENIPCSAYGEHHKGGQHVERTPILPKLGLAE